jgi:hypothetical protein
MCAPLAGDVQGAAVVRRGAHDGQAYADLGAAVARGHLERNQRLVVVQAQHRIRVNRLGEQAIRRNRPVYAKAPEPELAQDRQQHALLFIAE